VISPVAGSIVVADFRGRPLPGEPNKLRPAVVLQDEKLFFNDYDLVFVAPITSDTTFVHPAFAVRLEPSARNGCNAPSWIIANAPMAIALTRTRPTPSSITKEELELARLRVAQMMGFPQISPLIAEFLEAPKTMA
jgi:mRNA interferase MazF